MLFPLIDHISEHLLEQFDVRAKVQGRLFHRSHATFRSPLRSIVTSPIG